MQLWKNYGSFGYWKKKKKWKTMIFKRWTPHRWYLLNFFEARSIGNDHIEIGKYYPSSPKRDGSQFVWVFESNTSRRYSYVYLFLLKYKTTKQSKRWKTYIKNYPNKISFKRITLIPAFDATSREFWRPRCYKGNRPMEREGKKDLNWNGYGKWWGKCINFCG